MADLPTNAHRPLSPAPAPAPSSPPSWDEDDTAYVRDPHRLVVYIVPFPAPTDLPADVPPPPLRFLMYTPPPPPLLKPGEGEKERVSHKVQRKWQQEVRAARENQDALTSWHGIKSRITKGVAWATDKTTSAQLDFLTRIPKDGTAQVQAASPMGHSCSNSSPASGSASASVPQTAHISYTDEAPPQAEPYSHPTSTSQLYPQPQPPQAPTSPSASPSASTATGDAAKNTAMVKLEEMTLIYPRSLPLSPEEIKSEFLSTILRTRKKAERDTMIATGLLPVSVALDWALVFVGWVFGGAAEVDAVWAASSFRGAKMARSLSKRLGASAAAGQTQLRLNFVPSERAEPLAAYLRTQCQELAPARFAARGAGETGAADGGGGSGSGSNANAGGGDDGGGGGGNGPRLAAPSEDRVLQAIGWHPSDQYEAQNWQDERWESEQVHRDLQSTMHKAAKAWDHWVDKYRKKPEAAVKK